MGDNFDKKRIGVSPLRQPLLNLEFATDAALQPMVQAWVANEIMTLNSEHTAVPTH